jgi:hypothetical protein
MDVAFEGLPALAGVYLGGSLEVGPPTNIAEAIGVPMALWEDSVNGYKAWAAGNKLRTAEYMAPLVVIRDLLGAYRGAVYGERTVGGRPINVPGEVGPRKLEAWEVAWKTIGFRPLSTERAWRKSEFLGELTKLKTEAQQNLADRYNNAVVSGNMELARETLDEVIAWNMNWLGKNRPELVITKDSLNAALKSRAIAKQPSKQMMPKALRMREEFGLGSQPPVGQ